MKKVKKYALIISIVFTSVFSVGFVDNYFEISKNLDIFTTLFKELNIIYVDETDPGKLMKTAIDAMLESLDPYTSFIPESEKEDFEFMTTGQYGGIGAIITTRDGWVYVSEPYEGFPAQKAGLLPGDKFLEIDGVSAEGKTTKDVSNVLKGQPNTSVMVLIERPGVEKPFEVNLIREEVKVSSVPYSAYVSDGIGYVKMKSFTRNVSKEIIEAINDLKKESTLEGLILDLRDNPGGLLNEAIRTTNIFVEKGVEVVNTKGKIKDWDKSYLTRSVPLDTNLPVVVLINSRSASASEIVSGAIQDFDRGIVIGQRSFGKGLVQQTRKLSYNSQLKVTISKYYIPSGRCIQALDYSNRNEDGSVGKVPDSLRTAFTTKNGRIVYDGGGITPDIELEPKKYSNILRSIVSKQFIFDYANQYFRNHDTIASPVSFDFDSLMYNDFKQFLTDKDYEYQTNTEKAIEDLEDEAEKEKYAEDIQQEIDDLIAKMERSKNNDIDRYRNEISEILELEIVKRYYYQKGAIASSLKHDDELEEAIDILENMDRYRSILTDYKQENEE